MKGLKHLYVIVLIGLQTHLATAQDERKVYFTGLGRVEIKNSAANGEVYKGDTASTNRNTMGVTLFDMGINLQPTDYFKVTSIIRLRNQFGGFFGQGSTLELRQLKIEGLIAKSIKYELGDIDVGMTPFTVYNFEDKPFYESPIFSLRRNISNYENLNETSDWRLQGAKAKALLFWGDSSLTTVVNAFGVRTRNAVGNLPNRFLVGGSLQNSYKGLSLGFNYVRFFEPKDIETGVGQFANDVMTSTLSLKTESESFMLDWSSELGLSYFDRTLQDTTGREKGDGFLISGLTTKLKKAGLKAGVKYRYVGPNFYSAAAQTLRINNQAGSGLFPYQYQGVEVRDPLIFDRYSEPSMYNGTLSPNLMLILPQYGNVLPYGDATPNRQGVSAMLGYTAPREIVEIKAEAHFLNEISGGYDRAFLQIKAGALWRLDSLLNFEKAWTINGGFRNEVTTSSTFSPINLTTNMIDLGTEMEVFKHFSLLLGWKMLDIVGNEFVMEYDALNSVESLSLRSWDEQQQWLSWGLKYDFSSRSFFTIHGNYVLYENGITNNSDYTVDQYYLNYTLQF